MVLKYNPKITRKNSIHKVPILTKSTKVHFPRFFHHALVPLRASEAAPPHQPNSRFNQQKSRNRQETNLSMKAIAGNQQLRNFMGIL